MFIFSPKGVIRWSEIPKILHQHKKVIRPNQGKGFSILESIQEALNADFNIQGPTDVMIDKIIEELVANPEYTRYYKSPYSQEDLFKYIKETVNSTEYGDKMATMFIPPLATALNIQIKYFKYYKDYYCQHVIKPIWTQEDEDTRTIFLIFTGGKFQPLVSEGAPETRMASPGNEFDLVISTPPNSPHTMVPGPEDSQSSPANDVVIIHSESGYSVASFQVPSSPPKIGRGKSFDLSIYENITPEQVDTLPHDIDGIKMYCININDDEDYKKKYQDGRYFKLTNTTRKGFDGDMKIGTCMGNYECENPECSYLKESGQPNHHQFTGRNMKFCFTCQCSVTRRKCGAIKCTKFSKSTGLLIVYLGNHTCSLKPEKKTEGQYKEIEEAIREHGNVGPKEICKLKLIQEVKKQMADGKPNKQKIKQILSTFNDRGKIKQTKKRMEQATNNEIHSLSAVAELKQFFDPFDKYYIYQINDGAMNDKPSYVFKSSREMANLMLKMDQLSGESHPLQDEVVYFDGMHKRCSGFKTLTLWVLQIVMRKLTNLATMEVKREDTTCCSLFWEILNTMLSEVKNEEGYKFNPKMFIVDEAGAVAAGIRNVFGEAGYRKTRSCHFHFKQNLERALNNVPEELSDLS